MANPFSLIVAGVDSGNNLLDLPSPTSTNTPYVDLESLSMTMQADGSADQMSFDIIEVVTPAAGPWWRSSGGTAAVSDNARVQFFDSRVSGSTPIFLGFVTNISGTLLENGLGTRASVTAVSATAWLAKTIIRKGLTTSSIYQNVDSFTIGNSTSTDQDIINGLLKKVNTLVTDATTQQLLNTSIISGSTRAIYSGSAQTIGEQTFKSTTLQSALDQVAEEAGGVAAVAYRYWIDNDGRLNYGPITASPLYADAPAEVVINPTTVATGSGSATTKLLAKDMKVVLDHDAIVKGVFVPCADTWVRYDNNSTTAPTNDPYFRSYNGTYAQGGAGLATRQGPLPHEVISAPKITQKSDRSTKVGRLARATMTSRGKPVRTVAFTISGAKTSQTANPDHSYGYSQGYKYDGTSYTLVKQWLAGQYVKVTAPPLDLGRSLSASNAARTLTTATLTTSAAHGLSTGDVVTVALTSGPTGYAALNGTYVITSTPTTTTFTYTTTTSGAITSGAAAGTITQQSILRIASLTMRFSPGPSYYVEYTVEADFRRQPFRGLMRMLRGE